MTTQDNNQDKQQQFVASIKSTLDDSVDGLGASDLSAITQARYQAIAGKTKTRSNWILMPAGAIATACLAVIVYNFILAVPNEQTLTQDSLAQKSLTREGLIQRDLNQGRNIDENTDIVSMFEGFDIYTDPDLYEDLEFHEWLDAYESSSQG